MLHEFQAIERIVDVPGRDTSENDVEHSYHLAMASWYLADSFPELDKDKIIRYALVHDLVEVHAGDTFAYGTIDELASKESREAAALTQLQKDWKDFSDLGNTIEVYEKKEDQEALFVYALDKIMPIIVILAAEGKTWKDRGITLEQLRISKTPKVALSPQVLPYLNELLEILSKRPELFAK